MMLGVAPARREEGFFSRKQFEELRELLYRRSGLYFADSKRALFEMRAARCAERAGVTSGGEYLALLRRPGLGQQAWADLIDAVTTHETSFFRHRAQLDAFRRLVLPEVLQMRKRAGHRTLRIWSAACSSGEEPYTLAILLVEALGENLGGWDVRILGTDVARSMIDKARKGEYTRYSFRGTPAYYIQKYFEMLGPDRFRVDQRLQRLVEFKILNFADDANMGRMRDFQVIFCRNALLYFDNTAKRRFVAHFYRALDPGGFFFIGHSESLHGVNEQFKLIHFPGAMGYRKPLEPERSGDHE